MSSPDSSSLSSARSTDDESVAAAVNRSIDLKRYFKPQTDAACPSPPKRPASPPHEYVLADNPDIAFVVMFRARFSDVFPKGVPHSGPQDIENGATDVVPGDHIERLLCALIGLALNRKKNVERGHYQRPLEEVVQLHAHEWPKSWEGKNPLRGGGTFASMTPVDRITLLKTLILWALSSSDTVQSKLKESYKQSRREDDSNQPLAVHPWGYDSFKHRYWIIQGHDDTPFRLYRESNFSSRNRTWWSVAGTIPELKAVANSLSEEKSQSSRRLSQKINESIPHFEFSEEKRKKRDYRIARKAAFARPEPGFSIYEGRTRGKKMKYTFDDDDDLFDFDDAPARRSTRNNANTPTEPPGPLVTASGRKVRSRMGDSYEEAVTGRRRETYKAGPKRSSVKSSQSGRDQANGYVYTEDDYTPADDSDNEQEIMSSGKEWSGDTDGQNESSDEELSAESSDEEDRVRSLVIKLRYDKAKEAGSVSTKTSTLADTEPHGFPTTLTAPPESSMMHMSKLRDATTAQSPSTPHHSGSMPCFPANGVTKDTPGEVSGSLPVQ